MILGMSIGAFTLLHVIITVVAIGSGLIVVGGMFASQRLPGMTALFLFTTLLTSVTGFLFPIHGFTPALGVGIVACVILAIALFALYSKQLAGPWRWIYVVTAIISLYLNVFVLVAQTFMKVSTLNALAPTQSEPPFAITQVVVLLVFILVGLIAVADFHPVVPVRKEIAAH
jgi:glucan phosphoethanolaminetransferase (alkaline phosphatase superfamily)